MKETKMHKYEVIIKVVIEAQSLMLASSEVNNWLERAKDNEELPNNAYGKIESVDKVYD